LQARIFGGGKRPRLFIGQAVNITVKLFASFRTGRFGEKNIDCPEASRISCVLQELGIAVPEVGVFLVNGRHAAVDNSLAPGDTLSVFPLIGGG